MKPFLRLAVVLGIACISSLADVTVSNVRSAQRAGTKLVDIDYNLAGSTPPFTVSVRISGDDGASFAVPVTSLSGAFGAGQTSGTDKRITWNAGVDWNGKYTPNMRFEVTTTDTQAPPASDDFVLIPAGNFMMGQTDIAEPVHEVTLSAFHMAKYETTKELWDEVRAWGMANSRGYTDLAAGNGSYASKGINHPVHSITWYDMVKWCNARSEKENLVPCYSVSGATYKMGQNSAVVCNFAASGYRLPTETEWEKAARGGVSGKLFPWGTDTISHSQANYYAYYRYSYDLSGAVNNYHPTYAVGGNPYTAPVDSFAPNAYGLFNMAGNMWEWCWDWYGSYTADSQTNPQGAPSGEGRVGRGGSWDSDAGDCRVANRNGYTPSLTGFNFGFRLARSSVP